MTARMPLTKVIVGWTMCMDASLNLVKVVGAIVDLVSMSAVFSAVAIHLVTRVRCRAATRVGTF